MVICMVVSNGYMVYVFLLWFLVMVLVCFFNNGYCLNNYFSNELI